MAMASDAGAASAPLVIYHHNCADGFGAAWVFHHHYRQTAARPAPEFVPGRYGAEPPNVTGRDVYLVDFSYKRPQVEQMLRQARSVTLIDHHQTAIEELRPLTEDELVIDASGRPARLAWYCDTQRSGATLAWDYLFPGQPRPLLLGHIEDRDLWRFKLPNTREIQAAVFSLPYTFEVWDKLMAADPHDLLSLTAQGAAIERKHRKDVLELVETCRRRLVICGHEVWVANLPHIYASDAGQRMSAGQPFAACYWDTETHRHFSLRSRAEGGMDVAALAATMGGGGHRHAAGFRVPRSHPLAQL